MLKNISLMKIFKNKIASADFKSTPDKKIKNFALHIPKPCNENWAGMTADIDGRFCGSCNKIVTDFTTMNEQQIKNYFRKPAEKKICGYFLISQLETNASASFSQKVCSFIQKGSPNQNIKSVLYFFAGLLFTLTGCKNPWDSSKGKVEQIDSTETNIAPLPAQIIGGDTSVILKNLPIDSSKTKLAPLPSNTLIGDTVVVPDSKQIKMGELG